MGNKWTDGVDAVAENRVVQLSDWVELDHSDEGTAKLVCWLPKGAVILEVYVNITTLFNDSGTDTVDVGTADSHALYLADADLTTAVVRAGTQAASPLVPAARLTADTAIYVLYNGQNNDATTGTAEVAIMWAPCTQKELD